MANKPTEQELRQQKTAEAVSKTELFFQKNAKLIYGCVAAVLLVALAILAYNRFIYQPKKVEAQKNMYLAEQKFAAGDFELALNGDDNIAGFAEIIDTYGSKAGEAVYLYAGGCALQTGDFQKAVEYFKKYDGKDKILLSRAQAGIGDAYVGLEDYKNALAAYEKAAATADNAFAAVPADTPLMISRDAAAVISLYAQSLGVTSLKLVSHFSRTISPSSGSKTSTYALSPIIFSV